MFLKILMYSSLYLVCAVITFVVGIYSEMKEQAEKYPLDPNCTPEQEEQCKNLIYNDVQAEAKEIFGWSMAWPFLLLLAFFGLLIPYLAKEFTKRFV